jgi:hypothetical protein
MVELMPRFSSTVRPQEPSDFSSAILGHQADVPVAHDFGDNAKSGGLLGLAQKLEPLQFEALKIIGRGARFEGPAAQHARPRRRHGLGGPHDLLFAFHRAGSGHHDELVAADLHAVHLDQRAALLEFLADELVGRRDAHGALHSAGAFQGLQAGGDVPHAYHPNHHAFFPFDGVDLIAELAYAFANVVDFLPGGVWPHRYDHGSPKNKKPTLASGLAAKCCLRQRHSTG